MLTIKAKVFGGTAPIPINVFINNIKNLDDIKFARGASFDESFNVKPGKYMITVSGMNPSKGHTEILVAGNFSLGPVPNGNRNPSTQFYSEMFYLEIT